MNDKDWDYAINSKIENMKIILDRIGLRVAKMDGVTAVGFLNPIQTLMLYCIEELDEIAGKRVDEGDNILRIYK